MKAKKTDDQLQPTAAPPVSTPMDAAALPLAEDAMPTPTRELQDRIAAEGTSESRALAELHNRAPAELFAPGGTREILDRIAAETRSIVADVRTPAGKATIRSTAAKIASSKARLEKVGVAYARKIKAAGVAIDNERRVAREFLEKLHAEIRAPLTALEDAEKARLKHIQTRLDGIVLQGESLEGLTVAMIQSRIDDLRDMDLGPDWGSALDMAVEYRAVALERLTTRAAELERVARQLAELEALRAEQAAQAARDRAQADADRKARAEAELEADRARQLQRDSERRALAAEQQAAQDRAAQERATQEAIRAREEAAAIGGLIAKKQTARPSPPADRDHAAQVHREIVADLMDAGLNQTVAVLIVTAIAKGKVPRLTITY